MRILMIHLLLFLMACGPSNTATTDDNDRDDVRLPSSPQEEEWEPNDSLENILARVEIERDDFEKVTIYRHQNQFSDMTSEALLSSEGYIATRILVVQGDEEVSVGLFCTAFIGQDWIFYDRVMLQVPPEVYEWDVMPSRDVSTVGNNVLVFEEDCGDLLVDDETFKAIDAASHAESSIRLSGSSNKDRDISTMEKDMYADMLSLLYYLREEVE